MSPRPKFDPLAPRCMNCWQPVQVAPFTPGLYVHCFDNKCAARGHENGYTRDVQAGEKKCAFKYCENILPAGNYHHSMVHFVCSDRCRDKLYQGGVTPLKCACCGMDYLGHMQSTSGLTFFNQQHAARYRSRLTEDSRCGIFMPIYREYMDGIAPLKYRHADAPRIALTTFFEFMNQAGAFDLSLITPATITDYLKWGRENDRATVANTISQVSTFFDWLIYTGKREDTNPVISRFHRKKSTPQKPRPYSADEMDFAWRILSERGTPQARLAVALGEESGLRVSEMANTRLEDFDLQRMMIFVRLPNKNMLKAWVPFSSKTRQYGEEWLQTRDSSCGHDHLLHTRLLRPFSKHSLHWHLVEILGKYRFNNPQRGQVHDVGFDRWVTHRLRHTMATNLYRGGAGQATTQAVGRWKTADAMAGYTDLDPEMAKDDYAIAMDKQRLLSSQRGTVETFSIEDLCDMDDEKGEHEELCM